MISDLENMNALIESIHYEGEDRHYGKSARRPERPSYDTLVDHYCNSYSNTRENGIKGFAGNG